MSEPALEEEKEEDNDEKSLAPVLNTDPSSKLMAMELSNQLAKEKQMKQQKDEAERKEKEGEPGMEDDESIRHHDPNYKFKPLNKPSHSENRSHQHLPPHKIIR